MIGTNKQQQALPACPEIRSKISKKCYFFPATAVNLGNIFQSRLVVVNLEAK
jgi:hypothetical protein